MRLPTLTESILSAILVVLILVVVLIRNDAVEKGYLIENLTANITKLTTIQSFVDDYNEYSSICNHFQNSKADILKVQCTQQGWEFTSYYVSYPANDFLILCTTPSGKTEVMRFRST